MVWNHSFPDSMFSVIQRRQQDGLTPRKLYRAATGNHHFVQRLKLDRKLEVHDGCVNTVCWNEKGSVLLSGSDDQHLVISNPFNGKILAKIRSGHRSNIFSAKFLPASMDRELVSCSGSGEIFYTDVDREDTYGMNRFDCHFGTTYKIVVVPNEAATFLSCGDDGTVRFFDLRVKTSCTKFNCEEDVVINLRDAVSAMAVDPVIPFQMAVGSADGIVRIYDRRMLKTKESGGSSHSLISRFQSPSCASEKRHYRITSLNYRPGSHDVLVNYSSENIYLFNTYDIDTTQSYSTQPLATGETSKTTSELNSTRMSGGNTDDEPSTSGAAAAASDNGHDVSGVYKPIKRLRLRGDWSDTGPDARPESEDPAPTNLIMQRMSDLLTRMLNSHGSGRLEEGESSANSSDSVPPESASRDRVPTTSQAVTSSDSTTAAAMLRSVMLNSTGNGARVQPSMGRENTESERYSISSEGLVSPELSSQDYDSTDMAAGQNQLPAREKPDDPGPSGAGTENSGAGSGSNVIGVEARKDKSSSNFPTSKPSLREGQSKDTVGAELDLEISSAPPGTSGFSKEGPQQASRSRDVHFSGHNEQSTTDCPEELQTPTIAMSDTILPGENDEDSTNKQEQISSLPHGQSDCSVQPNVSFLCSSTPTKSPHHAPHHEEDSSPCRDHRQTSILSGLSTEGVSTSAESSSTTEAFHNPLQVSEETVVDNGTSCQEVSINKDEIASASFGSDDHYIQSSQTQSSMCPSLSCSQISESSTISLSRSTYSDFAIAEENLSNCGDMSMMTSCGTFSSFSERLSGANSPEGPATDLTFADSMRSGSSTVIAPNTNEGSMTQERLQVQEENTPSAFSSADVNAEGNQKDESKTVNDQSLQMEREFSKAQANSRDIELEKMEEPVSSSTGAEIQGRSEISKTPSVTFDLKSSPKGKGVGKSSLAKTKDSSQPEPSRIYSPYNSGNMKYSVDNDPSDFRPIHHSSDTAGLQNSGEAQGVDVERQTESSSSSTRPVSESTDGHVSELSIECGPEAQADTTSEMLEQPGPSWQGAEASARQRRTGHSLPPTGNFKLYTDDDDDDDGDDDEEDNDTEEKDRTRRGSTDSDRMGRAASKIQELFRKRREAMEAAKLRELPQPRVLMKFAGHRNCRTMIKEANFYGDDYVMSGSDCGRILLWERLSGRMVMYLEADRHVVNCVQPNPVFPLIASSGIDYDIKVWAPLDEDCQFDEDVAEMIIRRNELMLVETRDTITVPAAFMLRVLASLSQIRTGRSSSSGQGQSSQEQSSQD